jgi:tRNA (cytidine/uridine-2'-O-)-methyltransferase
MPRIVLVEPEIPPNTGNIARTCAATNTALHLVAPLGFELSDRYLKRAGLDYWPHVDLHYHEDTNHFLAHRAAIGGRMIALSVYAEQSYTEYAFRPDDWLIFGSESKGLAPELKAQCDDLLLIPMTGKHVRSLNLSVSAAVTLFESLRQITTKS